MINTIEESAVIFLADLRKMNSNVGCTKHHILSPQNEYLPQHGHFFALQSVKEVDLIACKEDITVAQSDMQVVLIPIQGELAYKALAEVKTIDVGDVVSFSISKGQSYAVFNPYFESTIKYLEIQYESSASVNHQSKFDLEEGINSMIEVISQENIRISLGMYEGRQEGMVPPSKRNGVFAYVIQGAFEFQNRLLQPKDALALWDNEREVAFEALSNDAILLTIEL